MNTQSLISSPGGDDVRFPYVTSQSQNVVVVAQISYVQSHGLYKHPASTFVQRELRSTPLGHAQMIDFA